MNPQDQIDTGRQAEEFLRYLEDHPYFEGLLERVKLELASTLIGLDPDKTESFTYVRSRMIGVDDVMEAVRGDIFLAGEALKSQIEPMPGLQPGDTL